MQKTLINSGSSKVLVISKEMLAHAGIEGDRIEVQYAEDRIILSRRSVETVQGVGSLPQTAFQKFVTNDQGW